MKCNGNVLNGIAPTYCINDKQLWVEFGQEVGHTFTNIASKQCIAQPCRRSGRLKQCTLL